MLTDVLVVSLLLMTVQGCDALICYSCSSMYDTTMTPDCGYPNVNDAAVSNCTGTWCSISVSILANSAGTVYSRTCGKSFIARGFCSSGNFEKIETYGCICTDGDFCNALFSQPPPNLFSLPTISTTQHVYTVSTTTSNNSSSSIRNPVSVSTSSQPVSSSSQPVSSSSQPESSSSPPESSKPQPGPTSTQPISSKPQSTPVSSSPSFSTPQPVSSRSSPVSSSRQSASSDTQTTSFNTETTTTITPQSSPSVCSTACIIGLAVGLGGSQLILIILVVVYFKRRMDATKTTSRSTYSSTSLEFSFDTDPGSTIPGSRDTSFADGAYYNGSERYDGAYYNGSERYDGAYYNGSERYDEFGSTNYESTIAWSEGSVSAGQYFTVPRQSLSVSGQSLSVSGQSLSVPRQSLSVSGQPLSASEPYVRLWQPYARIDLQETQQPPLCGQSRPSSSII